MGGNEGANTLWIAFTSNENMMELQRGVRILGTGFTSCLIRLHILARLGLTSRRLFPKEYGRS